MTRSSPALFVIGALAAWTQVSLAQGAAASAPAAPAAGCTSGKEFLATDCPLTWHGITLYGTYDVGVGWASHGLPENGVNYEGEALVNRNGNHSQFLIAPNNLSQTGLGVRGKEEFLPGWSVVFNASTGINPQSGQLANMLATNTINNGLPRGSYSETGDGARAGQTFNDEFFGGVSSAHYGTLTLGRQRALGTDAMLQYDPANGAYSFSYIGYNGTMAGGGNTEDTRWDDAVKYRFTYGAVHFGAMYKFADGSGGCYSPLGTFSASTCTAEVAHNSAFGFDLGGAAGGFSADVVVQHYNQAISVLNPLLGAASLGSPYQATQNSINTNTISGPNLIATTNAVYGIVTDNTAVMVAAKYAVDPVKIYGGYEYIRSEQPVGSARHRRVRSGRVSPERRRRRQPGFPQDRAGHVDGCEIRRGQQDRHHGVLLSPVAERLPRAVGLLAHQLSQLVRGRPQRGVALRGPSFHKARRCVCGHRVFRRERRSGHRHSARPGRPLQLRQQRRSGARYPLYVLIGGAPVIPTRRPGRSGRLR